MCLAVWTSDKFSRPGLFGWWGKLYFLLWQGAWTRRVSLSSFSISATMCLDQKCSVAAPYHHPLAILRSAREGSLYCIWPLQPLPVVGECCKIVQLFLYPSRPYIKVLILLLILWIYGPEWLALNPLSGILGKNFAMIVNDQTILCEQLTKFVHWNKIVCVKEVQCSLSHGLYHRVI